MTLTLSPWTKDEIQADLEKAERETGIKTRFEDGMSVDQIARSQMFH